MSKTALPNRIELDGRENLPRGTAAEALQELRRHGYVEDLDVPAGFRGCRLHHPFAPDLLLGEDGLIEVPLGQPVKAAVPAPRREQEHRIFWGRGFAVLALIALLTFLGFALVVNLIFAT